MQRLRVSSQQKANQPWLANRRGAILVWFIVALPVLLTLLCVLLEVANLYLARAELTNALEAAALAAVKDWGDNNGGDTLRSRTIGNAYATANTINGVPVDLSTIDPNLNYAGPNTPCNENVSPTGVLVFGAIIDDDPDFVFDCCETPSCGVGTVQFDVSAQAALGGSDNEWGISFQPFIFPYPGGIPPDLRITRVVYTLPDTCEVQSGMGGFKTVTPRFDFSSAGPAVSSADVDDDPNVFVQDLCNQTLEKSAQSDVFGIDGAQVEFFIEVTDPCVTDNGIDVTNMTNAMLSRTLAVQFPDLQGDLNGFDIEDHIRFGAKVTNEGGNGANANIGGDEIGECMTLITICFNDGTFCTSTFFDNNDRKNECFPVSPFGANTKCAGLAPWGFNNNPPNAVAENHGLIVHPTGIPDLPCPPSAAANNNGQSLGSVVAGSCSGTGSGAGRSFAVRAQATFPVPSICCEICGIPVGPFFVTAKADALYDCATQSPRLYHLKPQNYLCVIP